MTPSVLDFAKDVLGIRLAKRQPDALVGIAGHLLSVLVTGRRGGKSLIASIFGAYDASVRDLTKYLRPGEVRYVVLVAAGLSQARALFRTMKQLFEVPMLAALVVGEPTNEEIELNNGVILKVVPCNSRTIRGLAISTVIFEELASFLDSDGYQSGDEVYAALAPSTAQFKEEARLIALSTPRGQRGTLWRLFKQAQQREDGYALQAPTWEMHPDITAESLANEKANDPVLYEQEYATSFLAGGDEFIPLHMLLKATGIPEHEHGRRTLAIDPAFDQDDFGLAIACRPKDSPRFYLEYVSVLKKPGFDQAMDQVAALANIESVHDVVTDQMSHRAIIESLQKRGLSVRLVPWTGRSSRGGSKHHRYGKVKAMLSQGELALVDDPQMRAELSSFTVFPAAVDPGYRVESRGPDDQADAAVMAITEAVTGSIQRFNYTEYGLPEYDPASRNKAGRFIDGVNIRDAPQHQQQSLRAIYGTRVPRHAIDRDEKY